MIRDVHGQDVKGLDINVREDVVEVCFPFHIAPARGGQERLSREGGLECWRIGALTPEELGSLMVV